MTPTIRVDNLSVWYGSRPSVKEVSFSVPSGQVLALVGPSGCGKSTLLRVLNRLIDRDPDVRYEGGAWIEDVNVLDPSVDVVAVRRRVGMVFQQPNPFPFSIFDNVAYGPRLRGIKHPTRLRKIVEDSLKRAALWDEVRGKLRRPARALSGGQQQRLCIARALAVKPQVLLMDEPTAALDPLSTAKIEELMEELRGHYTIIIVTHNLQQAARVSDLTAFLHNGKLIEMGATRTVFTMPHDARTEKFLTGRYE